MAARITIKPRTGESTIYRDGEAVGTWPQIGFNFQIDGQMTGLAGTEESARAYALWFRDRSPVPGALADESKRVLSADHNALLSRFPFTEAEKTKLRESPSGFSESWIAGMES